MYNFQGWYDMHCVRLTAIDSHKDLPKGRYYHVMQNDKGSWSIAVVTMKHNRKGEWGSIRHNLNPFKGKRPPEKLFNVLPIEAQDWFTLNDKIASGTLSEEVNEIFDGRENQEGASTS